MYTHFVLWNDDDDDDDDDDDVCVCVCVYFLVTFSGTLPEHGKVKLV